jgi:cytochrome c peroxidase
MQTLRHVTFVAFAASICLGAAHATDAPPAANVDLGRRLFADTHLSRDGRVSCQTCHDPEHAYADSRPRSIGTDGKVGTRNALSLVDIADDDVFFWDGRRTALRDAVLDPLTNPSELGLATTDEVIARLREEPWTAEAFRKVYPNENHGVTLDHIRDALLAFVQSLSSTSAASYGRRLLNPQAQLGRSVFEGIGGCTDCHATTGAHARFSDGGYHRSGVGDANIATRIPLLTRAVIDARLDPAEVGPRVLGNEDWSALGRFVVTRRPPDVGAFRTPSLRNVAVTAPYMHDGSIATLSEAVDHEIYYHSIGRSPMVHISADERAALLAYLETLTDSLLDNE